MQSTLALALAHHYEYTLVCNCILSSQQCISHTDPIGDFANATLEIPNLATGEISSCEIVSLRPAIYEIFARVPSSELPLPSSHSTRGWGAGNYYIFVVTAVLEKVFNFCSPG